MGFQYSALKIALLGTSLALGLTACGGGGSDSSTSTTNPSPQVTDIPVAPNLVHTYPDGLLQQGSAANLTEQDVQPLLNWALGIAKTQQQWQKKLLTDFYTDAQNRPLNSALKFSSNSINIYPYDLSYALPVAVADGVCGWELSLQGGKGCGLGAAAKVGNGRAVAFGQDLVGGILNKNTEVSGFAPVLNNSLKWLIQGETKAQLPETIKIAVSGYNSAQVQRYLQEQFAVKAEILDCNVLDTQSNCWQEADLIFIGSNIGNQNFESELIIDYLKAGKGIYFQASNWSLNASIHKVLHAMGMETNHNLYRASSTLEIPASRTTQQSREKVNQVDAIIEMLQYFLQPHVIPLNDLDSNHQIVKTLNETSNTLQKLNHSAVSAFSADNSNQILKALCSSQISGVLL